MKNYNMKQKRLVMKTKKRVRAPTSQLSDQCFETVSVCPQVQALPAATTTGVSIAAASTHTMSL